MDHLEHYRNSLNLYPFGSSFKPFQSRKQHKTTNVQNKEPV